MGWTWRHGDLAGQNRPVARFREVASAVVDRIYKITS